MMEDFNRLIELLLPTLFRKPRLLELLRELVATPLQSRFSEFNLFASVSDYDATVTPQVCSLAAAVERRFDCVCEITELNGKPYDFLVSIDRSTDMQAIKEFVEMHKLAGKSFVFELGDAAFSATWINYVIENLIELYTAEWSDYVDEQDGSNPINIAIVPLGANNEFKITVNLTYAAMSALIVRVVPFYPEDHPLTQYNVNIGIGSLYGETIITEPTVPNDYIMNYWAEVDPLSDAYYKYQIVK